MKLGQKYVYKKKTTRRHCLKVVHAAETAQLTQLHFNAKCMQCAMFGHWHEIASIIGKKNMFEICRVLLISS